MSPPALTHAQDGTVEPATPTATTAAAGSARLLSAEDAAEVLAFLAERPLHTVNIAGLIRDNGMESRLNRGAFYGCRDEAGRLEGVSLIGHIVLVESRSERAVAAFARLPQGRLPPERGL
jgi:hypothetical protein